MSSLTETDISMEIDEDLKNKGWRLTGKNKGLNLINPNKFQKNTTNSPRLP